MLLTLNLTHTTLCCYLISRVESKKYNKLLYFHKKSKLRQPVLAHGLSNMKRRKHHTEGTFKWLAPKSVDRK